jgi:hypothetical protein
MKTQTTLLSAPAAAAAAAAAVGCVTLSGRGGCTVMMEMNILKPLGCCMLCPYAASKPRPSPTAPARPGQHKTPPSLGRGLPGK